jgi:hypothetical protein
LGHGLLGWWADRDQTAHGNEGVLLVIQKLCQFGDGGSGICSQNFKPGYAKLLKILR